MKRTILAVGAALGLALVGLFTLSPAAAAQDGGALVIAAFQCPDGYDGGDFAADCDSPASGIEFTIGTPHTDNSETTTSRGDGLATFSLAPYDLDPAAPDTVGVGEPATQTSDYAVVCTRNGDEPLGFSYETIPFEPGGPLLGITFEFEAGDQIACEWYRIRVPLPGEDDDSGADVGELPNTGVGPTATGAANHLAAPLALGVLFALTGGAVRGLHRCRST